jgi:orotate phosphoribosyltransferase
MSKEDFVEIARACNGYWMHSDDPIEPHAELASGFCSNGYLNLMNILQYSNLSQIFARQIINKLPTNIDIIANIDWVLGSAYTATGLSKDVANLLGARWTPLEKDMCGEQLCTRVVFSPIENILHVEDIVTTGKSLLSAHRAIRKAGSNVHLISTVPVLVFRPAPEAILQQPMIEDNISFDALFEFNEFWVSPSTDCILCQQGSRPLKPKSNWAQFSGV